jgi:hypothetical protein
MNLAAVAEEPDVYESVMVDSWGAWAAVSKAQCCWLLLGEEGPAG